MPSGQRYILELERNRDFHDSSWRAVHQPPIAEFAQGQLLFRFIAKAIADDSLRIALVIGFIPEVGWKALLDAGLLTLKEQLIVDDPRLEALELGSVRRIFQQQPDRPHFIAAATLRTQLAQVNGHALLGFLAGFVGLFNLA